MEPIKVETPQEHIEEIKPTKVKFDWGNLNVFQKGESYFFEGVNCLSLGLGMRYIQGFYGNKYKWKQHVLNDKKGTLITRIQ